MRKPSVPGSGPRRAFVTAGAAVVIMLVAASCSSNSDRDGAADTTVAVAVATETAAPAVSAAPDTAAGGIRTVAPADFAATLAAEPTRQLIDLRRPEEFASGHLLGATDLDFYAADFDAKLAAMDRAAPIAIYCHSGNRSGQTVVKLRALGFTDVVELGGGIAAWAEAGQPVAS